MCLAVPGKVESIHDDHGTRMGRVNFGGVMKDVCLAYLPEIAVGDYAIVHVGFAISKIDEASARETLRTLSEIGVLDDAIAELRETGSTNADGIDRQDAVPPGSEGGSASEASMRHLASPSSDFRPPQP